MPPLSEGGADVIEYPRPVFSKPDLTKLVVVQLPQILITRPFRHWLGQQGAGADAQAVVETQLVKLNLKGLQQLSAHGAVGVSHRVPQGWVGRWRGASGRSSM